MRAILMKLMFIPSSTDVTPPHGIMTVSIGSFSHIKQSNIGSDGFT